MRARPQRVALTLDAQFQQRILMLRRQRRDRLVFQLAGLSVVRLNLIAHLDLFNRYAAVVGMHRRARGKAERACHDEQKY